MHAFPPAADLQFLMGLEVQQICLDPWGVRFQLHPEGSLYIEKLFEHSTADGKTYQHDVADRTVRPLLLYDLVQQAITRVASEPAWLTLGFANGSTLRIFAEVGGMYESGQIHETNDMRFCTVF